MHTTIFEIYADGKVESCTVSIKEDEKSKMGVSGPVLSSDAQAFITKYFPYCQIHLIDGVQDEGWYP